MSGHSIGSRSFSEMTRILVLGLMTYGLNLLFNTYLARHMTAGYYGDASIGIQVLGIMACLIMLGSNTVASRFLPGMIADREVTGLTHYIKWNTRLSLTAAAWVLLVIALGNVVMWLLQRFDIRAYDSYHLAVYMLWITPLFALFMIANAYYQSTQRVKVAYLFLNVGIQILGLLLFVLAGYFLKISLDQDFVWIFGLAYIVLCAIQIGLLVPTLPISIPAAWRSSEQPDKEEVSLWTKASVRLVSSSLLYYVMMASDLLLVEIFVDNERSVDYYAAALSACAILNFIPPAFCSTLKPALSMLRHEGVEKNRDVIQACLNQTNIALAVIVTVIVAVLLLIGRPLLNYFGPGYVAGYDILCVVLAAKFVLGVTRYTVSVLICFGHEKVLVRANMSRIITIIPLGIWATVQYGVLGTAYATSAIIIIPALYTVWRSAQLGFYFYRPIRAQAQDA